MTDRPSAPRPAPSRPRRPLPLGVAALGLALLAACHPTEQEKAEAANQPLPDVVAETELGEVMLTLADTDAAVEYFRRALGRDPENRELKRGFALALARDRQNAEARIQFQELADEGLLDPAERVIYARTLGRLDMWSEAEAALAALPRGYATAPMMQLRGMIADHRGDWPSADAAYQTALTLTAQPAAIHNNIGVSMMARGDMQGAETAFRDALIADPNLFEAKNNLALTYALQGEYRLPVVSLSEEERAILLHNMALIALRQDERDVAITLLERAVDTHPRSWSPAVDKLARLKAGDGA